MKKSNEAMEIEQLKNKIEKYRKALASLKLENSSGDIHLKRRVSILEKNIEKLDEQVQELALIFEEGIAYLSNEIRELAEKMNEQPVVEKETVQTKKASPRIEQPKLHNNNVTKQDTQTKSQKSSLPSFRQLKEMAQQPTIQSTESSKYNTPRYYTPAVPIENVGLRELEPIVYEEKNSPSIVEPVENTLRPLTVQPSRAQKEIEEPQPIHRVNQMYGTDENETSPFWKMFKKK